MGLFNGSYVLTNWQLKIVKLVKRTIMWEILSDGNWRLINRIVHRKKNLAQIGAVTSAVTETVAMMSDIAWKRAINAVYTCF